MHEKIEYNGICDLGMRFNIPSHPVDCTISHAYLQRLHVWAGKCKACKHCGINITASNVQKNMVIRT